jgi:toxin ParE1/3/4
VTGRLKVLPEAEEELFQAIAWYEERKTGLGIELAATIDRELEAILDLPLANAPWLENRPYRRRVIRRFPYVIFYRYENDAVIVIAIAHTRRKAGYWLER